MKKITITSLLLILAIYSSSFASWQEFQHDPANSGYNASESILPPYEINWTEDISADCSTFAGSIAVAAKTFDLGAIQYNAGVDCFEGLKDAEHLPS